MALDLTSALAKTGRAADHLNALCDDIGTRTKRKIYRLADHVNADRTEFRFTLELLEELPFLEWSLIIGDCVSNLRSSLDHLVYAIALHESKTSPPPNEGSLAFPICDKDTVFADERTQKKIRTLSRDVRTAIESVQPYKRPHPMLPPLLSILRDFDNTNKHKLLRLAYASPAQVKIRTFPQYPGATFRWRINYSELKQGTEVVAVSCDRTLPHVNCQVTTELMVALWHGRRDGSAPPWAGRTDFWTLLKAIGDEVSFVIQTVANAVV